MKSSYFKIHFNRFWEATLVALMLFAYSFETYAAESNREEVFIKPEISKNSPYEGETFVLTYYLYSTTPEINSVTRIEESTLKNGNEAFR